MLDMRDGKVSASFFAKKEAKKLLFSGGLGTFGALAAGNAVLAAMKFVSRPDAFDSLRKTFYIFGVAAANAAATSKKEFFCFFFFKKRSASLLWCTAP